MRTIPLVLLACCSTVRSKLIWCNTPVLPNETLMLHGAGWAAPMGHANQRMAPKVTLQALGTSFAAAELEPLQVTDHTIMVVVPAEFPVGAYEATVAVGNRPCGNLTANAPDIYWAQGDSGDTASPGGWLRVFGRGLSLAADAAQAASGRALSRDIVHISASMASAAQRGNVAELRALVSKQSALTDQLERANAAAADPSLSTVLSLSTAAGVAINITAEPANLSTVAATFAIPVDLAPGDYTLCVSNGPASSCLNRYYSPTNPEQKTFRVMAPEPWPTKVFSVDAHGCVQSVSNRSEPVNCTSAVFAAIEAAGSAGGGVVKFGAGRYYVHIRKHAPLLLPNNVRLIGAGMGQTAIYFASNTISDVPYSMISNAVDMKDTHDPKRGLPGRWGMSDLDIYILSFYINVFNIAAETDGVELARVRLRANAFFCQNQCKGNRDPVWGDQSCQNNINWPYNTQPAVGLFGRNFKVVDCDLWTTWGTFFGGLTINRTADSDERVPGDQRPYAWTRNVSRVEWPSGGLIRGNTLWNGGNCHWFDGFSHLIYEDNVCTGNSPMAGGNNIATYEGGFSQHLYIGGNTYRQAYGNDREVMTYDDAGSVYGGRFIALSSDGRNLTTPGGNFSWVGGPKMNADLNIGKGVFVVNGTGAGQYRRVVDFHWSHDETGTIPSWWVLDRPFEVSPDHDAVIAISTFRGEMIFHNNHYEDAGAFQVQVSIGNVFYGLTGARMGGFLTQGGQIQWSDPVWLDGTSSGTQPDYYNQWIGIEVEENLWPDHREGNLGTQNFTGWEWGDPLQTQGYSFITSTATPSHEVFAAGAPDTEIEQRAIYYNRYIEWRRCVVPTNGGFMIQHGADMLLENNAVGPSVAGRATRAASLPPVGYGPYLRSPTLHGHPFVVVGHPEVGPDANSHWASVYPGNVSSMGTQGVLLRNNLQSVDR